MANPPNYAREMEAVLARLAPQGGDRKSVV